MAGLGKKKLQRKAKQAEKRASKKENNQGEEEQQPSSSSSNPGNNSGISKKKLQRKAKQAEKQAAKKENNQGEEEQPSSSSSNPGNVQVLPPDEWFSMLKNDVLDCGPIGNVLDGILRNTVRMTVELRAPRFGSLPLLLGKNLVYIQLVVIDTDRSIQGKLYTTGAEVEPYAVNVSAHSRKLFKDAVPYLLKDTDQWLFSRSLVFKGYNGVIEKAVQFPSYDPTDDLLELPKNLSGIRCAEVFLFVAGDFDVKEDGLCSRDAVKELLHELNSKEGISKLLAFDVVAASVVVSKEKSEGLKDVHLSLIA
ncbi:uncharacterized protein LOC110707014 [Chenopodium quinoa]|uniref:Uncharacterized protein n=1 Tax=Chenopodium quinoa TaxID=63459 RepID=A0A803LQ84_CHEQI|nr:uncharacterized protein LOC110707014 [Chenopodium quinoa]